MHVLLLLMKTWISVAKLLQKLLYDFLVLLRKNIIWGLGLVDIINVNLKPEFYLMCAKPRALVIEGSGCRCWSQEQSASWLHTYILDCFLLFFLLMNKCIGSRVKHEFVEDGNLIFIRMKTYPYIYRTIYFHCFLLIMHRQWCIFYLLSS
jgi:hypothetical protein